MKTKKINEADLRKIINKKIYESLNVNGISSQIKDWAYGVIDYLYQEGVMEYSDERKLMAMGNGKAPINYNEIIKLILSNNTTSCDCEAGQVLRNYLKVTKSGDAGTFSYVEDAIRQAFKEFADNSGIGFYNTVMGLRESDVTRIVHECVKKTLNEIGDTKWGSYRLGAVAARNSKKAIDAKTPQDSLKYHKTVRDALNTFDKASNGPNGERDSKLSKAFKKGLAAGQKLKEDNEGMPPEEQEFRASLPKMFIQNEDEFEYIGKMPNGNTMIKYLGMPFEVTPQGRMLPAKNLNEDVESSNGLFSEPIENIRIGDEIIKIAQAASNISRVLAAYTEDDPLEEWADRVAQEAESFAHDYTPEAYSK